MPWHELFLYSARQAFHCARGTFTKSLKTLSPCSPNLAVLQTPWGSAYIPRALDRLALSYLLRETLDKKHWHQYESSGTPVESGDTVIDCGASEGLWSLSVTGRVKKVFLIEAQPAFLEALEKTFAPHIARGRAEILACAAGSADGCGRLVLQQEADILGAVVPDPDGQVPLRRLDTLFAETPVSFIKVDVEGFEMDLLRGAAAVIRRDRPKIATAVYHEPNDWREIRDYVCAVAPGYRWQLKGLMSWGKPIMLHLWPEERTSTSELPLQD